MLCMVRLVLTKIRGSFKAKKVIVKSLPVFVQIFATPKDHRKAKPFHDHVFAFSIIDGHVWFRNYQVTYCSIFVSLDFGLDELQFSSCNKNFGHVLALSEF